MQILNFLITTFVTSASPVFMIFGGIAIIVGAFAAVLPIEALRKNL